VKDLGSTNGTFVDSVQITEAIARTGSSIRAGDTSFRISAAPVQTVEPSQRTRLGGLVGESLPMRELFAVLELASPSMATVLIQGESGTGKEVAARTIHDRSPRADKPFVIVDCSAAVEQLIESQLFGHVRGSFTGAVGDRKGAFVEGHGGTVFLDEIGELPLQAQARLLRVLEAHTVQPIGSDRPTSVDVRVVAATHRDLRSMVEEQKFRFDLFHRLAVVHVLIPPLRERLDDLPSLVRVFYEGRGVDPGPIEGEPLEQLRHHLWPGNVRELRNVLERAFVLSGSEAPRFSELKIWFDAPSAAPYEVIDWSLPYKEAKERWLAAFERRYISAVYARCDQNISRAAEHAGLSRVHVRTLLDAHDLRKK
jgi:transcriptional regulator with GAF, ATPase, and Fis domain